MRCTSTLRLQLALFVAFFLACTALGSLTAQALVRIENLTKVPGSDRGFPADDFFTFQRTLDPVNSIDQITLHTEQSGMRIHNDGRSPLVITTLTTSDTNDFTITGVTVPEGGLSVAPGRFVDVLVNFVTDYGEPKRLVTATLELASNAANAADGQATFRGAYHTATEGNNEVSAQQVFEAFGFTTMFGRNENGQLITRPSSDYPSAQDVDAGREGDMILSRFFVQSDPTQPIQMIQLSALHAPGGAPTELRDTLGARVVGDMLYNHGELYHQTLLPKETNTSEQVAGDFTARLENPFEILIAGYRTSGGGRNNLNKNSLLGIRVYLAKDRNGRVIPNEYILNQDYIGDKGCGQEGSANCDWNDNTSYIINARPLAEPSARRIENVTAEAGQTLSYTVNGSFDKGYPGNRLSYSAIGNDGQQLPDWIAIDSTTGTFVIDAPASATGSVYQVQVTATDYNRLMVTSTFTLLIDGESDCTVNANVGDGSRVLGCDSGTVQLSGETSTGTYAWTGPGSFTSTQASPTVGEAGTYVLRGGTDCDASSTVEVFAASGCDTGSGENQPPLADARANPSSGQAPLTVRLRGGNSVDPDGRIVSYTWRWPTGAASGKNAEAVFAAGDYCIVLTVTDDRGATGRDTVCIQVGNMAVARVDSVFLEAECATVGAQWRTEEADSTVTSGGAYATPVTEGPSDTPPADVADNRVRFEAKNMSEGFYRIFGRIAVPASGGDSYWVRVNDGDWYRWSSGINPGGNFQWNLRPGEAFFQEGTNTVDFASREADTRLDKIYLSKNDELPMGLGALGINCADTLATDTTTTPPVDTTGTPVDTTTTPEDTTTTALFVPQSELDLRVFPNPTAVTLNVGYSSSYTGPLTVFVIDLHGRRLREERFTKTSGTFQGELYVADLPRGTYRLQVVEGSRFGIISFLRQY